jgi:hypothetical protein
MSQLSKERAMIGKIFITRSGYDPKCGKHVKDPYLEGEPKFGACRPDIRKKLEVDDFVFPISGKVKGISQFVMAAFQVAEKMHAREAYERFPEQRLHRLPDGQLTGNVVIDGRGAKSRLDDHKRETFQKRLSNYILGKSLIVLTSDEEIDRGRDETLDMLQEVLQKKGTSPKELVGRSGATLGEKQALQLRDWLLKLKTG